MTVQAHAKVNLVLRVLGRRADGFHDIETLMVPISLADELEIQVEEGEGIELACTEPGVPTGPENLVWRAAELFSEETNTRFHLRATLTKNIPHGAGLGGGSSDAAATLVALDRLLATGCSTARLQDMAAALGSDVPFFIDSKPAWCRGRGEQMTPAPAMEPLPLILLKPPFPVPTAEAYKGWTSNVPPVTPNVRNSEWRNDLEAPVFRKYLLLPAMKAWLTQQPEVEAAQMSGSGSTVFGLLKSPAPDLPERARREFGATCWTCLCETLESGG